MHSEIQKLLQLIETRLEWGAATGWQGRDFDKLHQQILEKTGVSLSASTLKRVWGRARYTSAPSGVTLDALAQFAGFESYRAFCTRERKTVTAGSAPSSDPHPWWRLVLISALVLLAGLAATLAFRRKALNKHGPYQFSSHTVVTRGLPNSVVFSYDAPVGGDDSVFIQQSWDRRRRERVDPNGHVYTSVYYKPGFFRAKLIVDTQVVQEHALMVATDGWLGLIDNTPVPVYLKPREFLGKDGMQLSMSAIRQKIPLDESKPPQVRFYNVGNFDPIPVPLLSFQADVRNDYGEGAGACRITNIYLITDDGYGTILFPVGMKGCVSNLSLFCVDHGVSGKNADLSGFGLDSACWATVACRSTGGAMQFFVNNKMAFSTALPTRPANVVGVEFIFQGTGAVRNVRLGGKALQ